MIKRDQRGFTLIELLVVMAIAALIAGAASMTTFQGINVTKRSNDRMTVIRQVQNAGYWISRDAQMAEQIIVDDDPETPTFLTLTWTDWGYEELYEIYHSAVYSFQDLSDGIGKVQRTHWSSTGANEQTLVAEYIYYNPDDPDNTTKASYQSPVLTMQIAASFGEAEEIKEYKVYRRPNY